MAAQAVRPITALSNNEASRGGGSASNSNGSSSASETLSLRCGSIPRFTGVYTKLAGHEGSVLPTWKLTNPTGHFALHSDGSRWILAEEHNLFATTLYSSKHDGRLPWQLKQNEWFTDMYEKMHALGTIFREGSCLSDLHLPSWVDVFLKLKHRNGFDVYTRDREVFQDVVDCLGSELAKFLGDMEGKLQVKQDELSTCASGCMAAYLPDVELCVGEDTIPASKHALTAASPFFAAMLKDDMSMKEATTGKVNLPSADPRVVRRLLCLICSSGKALASMELSTSEVIDLLAQAAEWQCDDLIDTLLEAVNGLLGKATSEELLRLLRLSSLHAAASRYSSWAKILRQATDACAVQLGTGFSLIEELPLDAFKLMLSTDSLNTGDNEGRVLVAAVNWANKHEKGRLAELLGLVRFPLMRLTSLTAEEKAAMRVAKQQCGEVLDSLVGEAVGVQAGITRKLAFPANGDEDQQRRGKKRKCTKTEPSLTSRELGQVLCGSFCIAP